MPHLSCSLVHDEPIVDAVIGMDGPSCAALVAAGQPAPRPVRVRAVLDSGANATAIAPHVFQQLGLTRLIGARSQTASGIAKVDVYRISLGVYGPAGASGPALTVPDLVVCTLAAPLPNLDALIGMDVLRECLLVMDGPGQQFILAF